MGQGQAHLPSPPPATFLVQMAPGGAHEVLAAPREGLDGPHKRVPLRGVPGRPRACLESQKKIENEYKKIKNETNPIAKTLHQ